MCLLPLFHMYNLHSNSQFTSGVGEEIYMHEAPGDEIQSLIQ